MVLVTSSMAEEVCKPFLADSSEEVATWVEAMATCDAASRTSRTSPRRPSTMRVKAFARVSLAERGRTSTARLPPAMASETAAISFKYFTIESKVRGQLPNLVFAVNVNVVFQIARLCRSVRPHESAASSGSVIPAAVR